MGKRPIEPVVNKARPPRMPKWSTIALACTLGVAVVYMAGPPFLPWVPAHNDVREIASKHMDKSNNNTCFDWEAVSPSRDLEYVPCYGRFQCARLLLPMDWTDEEENWHNHEVAIAMIKQSANVSVLDPRYGGEIFLNPGGPGVQGVTMLTGRLNDHLVNAINGEDPDGKVFDLVSFDPRGVGFSTPRISCFDDLVARQLWHQLGTAYGDVSGQSFDLLWARARSLEKLCDAGNASSEKALFMSTVSTAFVARDLLAMVEKSGEAREQRAREAMITLHGEDEDSMVPESLQYQPGNELLQYWGFSYGTFLGGTFASLYPTRVGRMIVDGCGEWEDEASGEFLGFLLDTDNEWSEFFRLCYAAGPDKCAIYDEDGPKTMQKSVAGLLETLQSNPVPVYEGGMAFPDLFTRDILVQGIFGALYRPYRDSTWIKLAETLSALLNGTIPSGAINMLPSRKFHVSNDGCKTTDCVTEGMSEGFWSEINYGIYCTDGLDFRNLSKSEMAAWVATLQQQSPLFGNMFATTSKLPCVGYPARPKWRFGGPFGGKTKTPMLFIGNTFDPVAPLEGTRKNVEHFEGARLLQQDSVGHCSTNAPSKCTVSYIRRYLVSGELPEEGTMCSVDGSPFDEETQ